MLIKNARFILSEKIIENENISIDEKQISSIGNQADKTDLVIDASDYVAIPGLINMHTHSGMTVFRGNAEDMELYEWLSKKIWPFEKKLKPKDIEIASLVASLEMLKTGTTMFNDMYFFPNEIKKASEKTGIKSFVSQVIFDENFKKISNFGDLMSPHSIYTCSEETLLKSKEIADKENKKIHIHLSETRKEVYDCIKKYGMRPVEYLEKIGFLEKML